MAEQQPNPAEDAEEAGRILDYAPPDPPAVSAGKVFTHAVATMVGLMFTTIFAGASAGSTNGWSMLAIPVVIAVFLIAAGYARRQPGGRSLAIGILIGIGLPLLIVGLCFGVFAMR